MNYIPYIIHAAALAYGSELFGMNATTGYSIMDKIPC